MLQNYHPDGATMKRMLFLGIAVASVAEAWAWGAHRPRVGQRRRYREAAGQRTGVRPHARRRSQDLSNGPRAGPSEASRVAQTHVGVDAVQEKLRGLPNV